MQKVLFHNQPGFHGERQKTTATVLVYLHQPKLTRKVGLTVFFALRKFFLKRIRTS